MSDDTNSLETELDALEQRLAASSQTFKADIATQHKHLSEDFAAADKALEEFAEEIEKGDGEEHEADESSA